MPDPLVPNSSSVKELDVVLCRGTVVGDYSQVVGTYDVEFVRPNGVGSVRSIPAECVLALVQRELVEAVMGVLDEIAADADEGRLGMRNCQADAERILALAFSTSRKPGGDS